MDLICTMIHSPSLPPQPPALPTPPKKSENNGILLLNPSTKLQQDLLKHPFTIKTRTSSLKGRKYIIYHCVLKCWHKYFTILCIRCLTAPQQCEDCDVTLEICMSFHLMFLIVPRITNLNLVLCLHRGLPELRSKSPANLDMVTVQ